MLKIVILFKKKLLNILIMSSNKAVETNSNLLAKVMFKTLLVIENKYFNFLFEFNV